MCVVSGSDHIICVRGGVTMLKVGGNCPYVCARPHFSSSFSDALAEQPIRVLYLCQVTQFEKYCRKTPGLQNLIDVPTLAGSRVTVDTDDRFPLLVMNECPPLGCTMRELWGRFVILYPGSRAFSASFVGLYYMTKISRC